MKETVMRRVGVDEANSIQQSSQHLMQLNPMLKKMQ